MRAAPSRRRPDPAPVPPVAPRDQALESTHAGKSSLQTVFAGLNIVLDASGAAFIETRRALIVSDLHLEKGSAAAARGRPVPAHDSRDTLQRLERVIDRYEPRCIICLGDSFHDVRAGTRMAAEDKHALARLCASVPEWIWIGGNHDPEVPAFCEGILLQHLTIDGIVLRHDPVAGFPFPQIAGHYHPKTSVSLKNYRFSGRCFCVSKSLIIMPAFGAYTGGLACSAPAFAHLHQEEPKLFMIHAAKLWRAR